MQISEVSVKVCFVGSPRQSINARCGIFLSSKNASPSSSRLMWCRSAVNFSFFLCLAACRMRSSARDTVSRLCARPVLLLARIPLGLALGSDRLRSGSIRFVRRLPSCCGRIFRADCLRPRIIGDGSSPSRCRIRQSTCPPVGRGVSRFPRKELPHMPVSSTTPGAYTGRSRYRAHLCRLPSAERRRTRDEVLSRLNGWPMRSPVNASRLPSRATAHDLGSMRFATPSS